MASMTSITQETLLSIQIQVKSPSPLHAAFSLSRTGVSYVSRRRRKDFRVVAEDGVGGWRFTVVVVVVMRCVEVFETTRLVLEDDVQGVDDAGDVCRGVLSVADPGRSGVKATKTYNRGRSTAS